MVLRLAAKNDVVKSLARTLRSQLKVTRSTRLIGILNGDDTLLEKLWAVDRQRLFDALLSAEFDAITGPTFSVYGETRENPASHNVTMLNRHHRFCAEANAAGLIVIPNLYWRDAVGIDHWVDWIRENPTVTIISRDFSRTKQWACFRPEFDGLLEIIERTSRPLHTVLLGIGEEKLRDVAGSLRSSGAGVTVVSARPIVAPPPVGIDRSTALRFKVREFLELLGHGIAVEGNNEQIEAA